MQIAEIHMQVGDISKLSDYYRKLLRQKFARFFRD
jgi:catechol-2,3-dioxygenase